MNTRTAEPTRMETLHRTILSESMKKKIAAELSGKGVDADKFALAAVTALRQNQELSECNPSSVYRAVQAAAHDGLLPDGREGVITVYNKNVGDRQRPQWEKHAQWSPMIHGLIKRLGAHRIYLDTQVVYENDEFSQEFGDNPAILHRPPKLGQDRGKPVGVYAIVKLSDGHVYREVMDIGTVETIRAQSKNKSGAVWTTWWDEMARKSVARRIFKRVPIPESVRSVVSSDDLDIEPDEPAATDAKPKLIEQIPANTVRQVVDPQPEPVVVPAEPGEILDPHADDGDV